jgi:hypothetical protein
VAKSLLVRRLGNLDADRLGEVCEVVAATLDC